LARYPYKGNGQYPELLKYETYQARMFATTYWVDGQQKIIMHIAF